MTMDSLPSQTALNQQGLKLLRGPLHVDAAILLPLAVNVRAPLRGRDEQDPAWFKQTAELLAGFTNIVVGYMSRATEIIASKRRNSKG